MASTKLSFNSAGIDPAKAFEPLPKGDYPLEVTGAEVVATKGAEAGTRVIFECTVFEGEFAKRKVWHSINVKNKSKACEEMGAGQMSAMCHVCSLPAFEDVLEFKGKRFIGQIGFGKDEYKDRNEVKGVKVLPGGSGGGASSVPLGLVSVPPVPGAGAPPPPPAGIPAEVFPPAGWIAHPTSPGYFYCGNDVLSEADLRAKFAAPVAPAAPPAPPAAPAAPPAPPVAVFPPADWIAHPTSPGYFYRGNEVLSEADLRARVAGPTAPAAGIPASPTGAGSKPPWEQ